MRLQNKTALITGGSSGIGRETALLFAREGAKTVVVDVNDTGGNETAALIREAGGEAVYVHADVSKAADCAHMVDVAEKTFGALHILFNNAGIMHSDDDDAVATEEAVWDLTMNINVKGVFFGCKYGIPALRRAGGGSIINTASFVALLGAANRDEQVFPNADQFELQRGEPGIPFGFGVHACLGAALVRLEARLALAALLAQAERLICPPPTELVWNRSLTVRGPVAMPVRRR